MSNEYIQKNTAIKIILIMKYLKICMALAFGTITSISSCGNNDDTFNECIKTTWYQDIDSDGLGNAANSLYACEKPEGYVSNSDDLEDTDTTYNYTGTASVTQGIGTTLIDNLYTDGQRIASLGTIKSSDGQTWVVPADVNYANNAFPFATDLYNPDGIQHASAANALAAFDNSKIIEVDVNGEVMTAYIFADNYFELYINGIAIGKDAIPFTQFNSHILKFKVITPYTIAMKLVDWEEILGLGSENQSGFEYHSGDGGIVTVIKDVDGNTTAITGSKWKAQTFYSSPIKDLTCPTENGTVRITNACNTDDTNHGSAFYGLHWEIPSNWMDKDFDDSDWPNATTYTNTEIGVDNKVSYTNFIDVFDATSNDAEFIWSTNIILDNEVLVRYTVE